MTRVDCGIDQQEGGASHHCDAGEVEAQHDRKHQRRGEQQPAGRPAPFGTRQTCRQSAVAGDHVTNVRRAEERRVDRRGGREQRRDGDQVETELTQERLRRLGERIVLGPLDFVIREVAGHGQRHGEIERDHEEHAGIERARQQPPGIAHVGGGVGHKAEALVADEQHARSEQDRACFGPKLGRANLRQ